MHFVQCLKPNALALHNVSCKVLFWTYSMKPQSSFQLTKCIEQPVPQLRTGVPVTRYITPLQIKCYVPIHMLVPFPNNLSFVYSAIQLVIVRSLRLLITIDEHMFWWCRNIKRGINFKLSLWIFRFSFVPVLAHWGRDKMAAISQTTFWNRFSWIRMYEFRFKFHWSLLLGAQLIIFQHWLR